jgi:predicted Zn-dependent protease
MPHFMRLLIVTAALAIPAPARAQFDFGNLPFANPEKMFEQFFGEDSDEDREALRKIQISLDEERRLGEQILEAGLAEWKRQGITIESKGRDVEYLQSLVETLRPHMEHHERYPKIRVMLARSPKVDAKSCPGGTLIFFEGLLDAAQNEAALAGIVGHELSHLDRGHQLLPLKRMKLMEQTFSKGFDPETFFKQGPWMTKLMARPFRPEDERDADRDGAAWAYAAGYDPREMAKLFQRQAKKKNEAELPGFASYFRTHPYDRERHQAILKQYAQLRKKEPKKSLFIGEDNLKQRRSRQQMED